MPASGDGLLILTNSSNGQRLHAPLEKAWLAALRNAREATPAAGGRPDGGEGR